MLRAEIRKRLTRPKLSVVGHQSRVPRGEASWSARGESDGTPVGVHPLHGDHNTITVPRTCQPHYHTINPLLHVNPD